VSKLARKRPSPLERGDLRIWAAAAIYTSTGRRKHGSTAHRRDDAEVTINLAQLEAVAVPSRRARATRSSWAGPWAA